MLHVPSNTVREREDPSEIRVTQKSQVIQLICMLIGYFLSPCPADWPLSLLLGSARGGQVISRQRRHRSAEVSGN